MLSVNLRHAVGVGLSGLTPPALSDDSMAVGAKPHVLQVKLVNEDPGLMRESAGRL